MKSVIVIDNFTVFNWLITSWLEATIKKGYYVLVLDIPWLSGCLNTFNLLRAYKIKCLKPTHLTRVSKGFRVKLNPFLQTPELQYSLSVVWGTQIIHPNAQTIRMCISFAPFIFTSSRSHWILRSTITVWCSLPDDCMLTVTERSIRV